MTQALTDSLQVQEAILRTLWPNGSSFVHTLVPSFFLYSYMGNGPHINGFCITPEAAGQVTFPALGFGPWLVALAHRPAALPLLSPAACGE